VQGLVYGSAIGVVLGLLAGAIPWIEDVLDPWVAAVYPIPKSALFPLFLLWFGLGDTSKIVTIAVGVLFLVLVNTVTGVKSINPLLIKAAIDLGASRFQVFVKVILPGSLPNIFTGLRLGAGMALILVFITEIEATKAGLGFLLWEAFQLLETKNVFAGVVTFGLLGVAPSPGRDQREAAILSASPRRQAVSVWKRGRVRQYASVSFMICSTGFVRSSGSRHGCGVYHGVSTKTSMRLPSGSLKYADHALPWEMVTSSLT